MKQNNTSAEQHTAGPWRVETVDTEVGPYHQVLDPAGDEVVTSFKTSPADAHLIAAATELLVALKTTAGNIRSLGPAGALDVLPEPYRAWLAVVDAAIVKARVPS